MNWTNTPPTKPGAYWHKSGPSEHPMLVEFTGRYFLRAGIFAPLYPDGSGEWSGPLVPVEEVRRAYYEGHIAAISSDPDMDPQEHSWPNSRARKIVEGEL